MSTLGGDALVRNDTDDFEGRSTKMQILQWQGVSSEVTTLFL